MGYLWRTRSFEAAPPGWHIALLSKADQEEPHVAVMPGWLIQEEVRYEAGKVQTELDDDGHPVSRPTRVVAGWVCAGQVEPGDDEGDEFVVLPPGEQLTDALVETLRDNCRGRDELIARRRAAAAGPSPTLGPRRLT